VAAHRRSARRARALEKALAALLLLAAFVVTVVLLGLQWLGNQTATAPPVHSTSYSLFTEVLPSFR
jgi:uncharacterized membrane protein YfbV (UPF0208 family)